MVSVSNPIRAWRLILTVALGLWLAPGSLGAGAQPPEHRPRGDALLKVQHVGDSQDGNPADARPDLVIVQAPVVRPGPLAGRFPQGSRLVRLGAADRTPRNLTPDFYAAADPRTSFDGAQVLFAGKKTPDSSWQIWK